MKFLPTVDLWNPAIDLWNPAIDSALRSGQLKLLPGQWIQCGKGPKSRFCGITPTGTIVATHSDGKTVSLKRFRDNLDYYKSRV